MDGSGPHTGMTIVGTSAGKIIGNHPAIVSAIAQIELCAPTNCNVLITGESGTGKELVAARVHEASARRSGRYIAFNCASICESLAESELFGHLKGSFSGAHTDRKGLIAEADGGTLFFDEIGELSLGVQAKLLRVIQERDYRPVGASHAHRVDVRIVAATHRDLEALVRANRFREDLYYRLNVMHVRLPALRDRGEDLVALANYFLQRSVVRMNRPALLGFSEAATDALRAWRWPGNVRELANVTERLAIVARGARVELDDLPPKIAQSVSAPISKPPAALAAPRPRRMNTAELWHDPASAIRTEGIEISAHIRAYEKALFVRALDDTNQNNSQAAALLGIKRTTFIARKKSLGIQDS